MGAAIFWKVVREPTPALRLADRLAAGVASRPDQAEDRWEELVS
jgi:hypothetical protein